MWMPRLSVCDLVLGPKQFNTYHWILTLEFSTQIFFFLGGGDNLIFTVRLIHKERSVRNFINLFDPLYLFTDFIKYGLRAIC